jgi:hypothetical protein
MTAVSRWVQFPVSATTAYTSGGITTYSGKTRGSVENVTALSADTINTTGANRLKIAFDGGTADEVVLLSGTYDPRIIAKDIEFKLHTASGTSAQYSQCEFINNKYKIWSGTYGAGSYATLSAASASDARATLGLNTVVTVTGSSWAGTNAYVVGGGTVTISGTFTGQFDDVYTVVVSHYETVGVDDLTTPTLAGNAAHTSGSYAGTTTVAGNWNQVTAGTKAGLGLTGNDTYTITISTALGTVMGGGAGSCPTMSWTSTGSDNSTASVELLYPGHWYAVGNNGLMIKFSDSPFTTTTGDVFTVKCRAPSHASAGNVTALRGSAKVIYSSRRGDCSVINSASPHLDGTATAAGGNAIGTKGMYLTFNSAAINLEAGDEYNIICKGPQPTNYSTSTTNLSFGNVTVSTNSAVKAVWFELTSGAVLMTTLKVGLQSEGSFQHHDQGNADTLMRFGSVGAGYPKSGFGDWKSNLSASELIAGTYTYTTESNLHTVDNADDSEAVGRYNSGLFSDFIFLCIKIGASETGASSVNYRAYFDYS